MASVLGLPDEYFKGLLKSGETLWVEFLGHCAPPAAGGLVIPRFPTERLASTHDIHSQYWRQQVALWLAMMSRRAGATGAASGEYGRGDRRFAAEAWNDGGYFDLIRESYLLNSRLVDDLVEAADVDDMTRQKLRFFSRQWLGAASPANFPATNPEAIEASWASDGESLLDGLQNLLADVRKGKVSITDETAFEVGVNLATSEGAVVFENEIFQLIQYAPLTKTVASQPLLIVPPCINKFYILDLQPENSFVRFAVESGLTVFLVSWRSASKDLESTTWEDYIAHGVEKAVDVALAVSSAGQLNAVGWCVGGTILASAIAVMRARGNEQVASLTLLTTMLDFADPGDLGVFIDEQGVSAREQTIGERGIYPGSELAFVFQTLRANDLIWPYVVNNYLKGKSPAAFDLLYWNADSTNLPGPMYCWYLRNMYLENNLQVPNRLSMCGVPVDLGRIDMPSYVLATQDDHIVPWRSAYRSVKLLGGVSQFVLGASGHIAGVINPASRNRRSYWTGVGVSADADSWLESANETAGSWWTHWRAWLTPFCGTRRRAPRTLGTKAHLPIETAPGRYVKERAS